MLDNNRLHTKRGRLNRELVLIRDNQDLEEGGNVTALVSTALELLHTLLNLHVCSTRTVVLRMLD